MKSNWIKIWERGEYTLTRMDEVVLSLLHPYTKKVLGFNISKTLVLSLPNGNVVFYVCLFSTVGFCRCRIVIRRKRD